MWISEGDLLAERLEAFKHAGLDLLQMAIVEREREEKSKLVFP